MPCDCIFANVFTVFVTLTFVIHLYSLASPCWICNKNGASDCEPQGIYDACAIGGTRVEHMGAFVLAILMLISNAMLMAIFCIKVRTSYLPAIGIVTFILIIWFFVQEAIFGSIIFGILYGQYDKVGWAAYFFYIPGLVMVIILLIMLGLYICMTKAVCAVCEKCCCCEPGEKA